MKDEFATEDKGKIITFIDKAKELNFMKINKFNHYGTT